MLEQIGAAFCITKREEWYYKMEKVLQSGAIFITKLGRYYKVGQTLITKSRRYYKWGNHYKPGQHMYHMLCEPNQK